MNIVYGPVPSRRLGMSLGIDPIPKLTCTFGCIYCQLGKKRHKVRGAEEVKESFPTPAEITAVVGAALAEHSHVDYITFSGSGEPTLNPRLKEAVEKIRRFTKTPTFSPAPPFWMRQQALILFYPHSMLAIRKRSCGSIDLHLVFLSMRSQKRSKSLPDAFQSGLR